MKRDEILDEAKRLTTGDRQADYGDASESFTKVGVMWEQIIGFPVSATDVALMMSALKIVRAVESPTKADNWVDLAGYAALGGEIAEAVTPNKPNADAIVKELFAKKEAQDEENATRCPHHSPRFAQSVRTRCTLPWGHGVHHEADGGLEWTF